jgi:hypothetical protein
LELDLASFWFTVVPCVAVRPIFISCLVLIGAMAAAAQNPAPTAINTDRPAVAASSVVVPLGSLQFENGMAETVSGGQRTFDVSETLLRFGAASKTELRLSVPDFFIPISSGSSSGFGDLSIGVKRQLGPLDGFDVSLVVSLSLPTGSKAISSHGYDPSVQLPWSRSISRNWTAAGTFSVYFPTQSDRRNTTGETSFLIDRQLTTTWDAFVEYVGDFPSRGGPRHLIHFGTACKLRPQQQLDFHGGAGLSSATVDHFIGIGYSFRLQAFHH